MTWKRACFNVVAACLTCWLTSATGHAQEVSGFDLNRFEPSETGSDWFVAESLDLRGEQRWAAGLVFDYGLKPLVIYSQDGDDEQVAIVKHQLFGHVGGAVVLAHRFRIGLNVPIAIYQNGEPGDALGTTFSSENKTTLGDIRVGGDVRLVGEYLSPATLAAGLQLHLPTGSRDSFTGDGAVRIVPRASLAGDIGSFTYAGGLGVNIRTQKDDFADADLGSELLFNAAAGLRLLDGNVTVGPELFGSTVFSNGDSFFARTTTPLEAILGGHVTVARQWRLGAGAGAGLTRGLGTPKFRAVASIEWVQPYEKPLPPPPEPEPSDRDGDRIIDAEDACPDVAGVPTGDPKTHGCPPAKDGDADGIVDPEDACPEVPGVRTDNPKTNGCPPDRDGDGVYDDVDACPDEPGVQTDDPKTNGCPLPKDRDGDGILDPEDACPDVAGPSNPDPKKHGCPLARVEKGEIKITEQVQFAFNSAELLKASDTILNAVKAILEQNPQIKKVTVEGHTDNKGNAAYNKNLSQRRAASVMKWLIKNGIAKERLQAKGHGKDRPIDTNDTEEGRANNRRVEFHIIGQDAAPAATE